MRLGPFRIALLAPLATSVALAAACSSIEIPGPDVGASATTSTSELLPPVDPTDLEGLGGLLAVVDADGAIETVDPTDGTVTRLAAPVVGNGQPTWSPLGDRLVWRTLVDERTPAIGLSDLSAGDPSILPASTGPFYFAFSPAGDRLAYLGGSEAGGTSLTVSEVGADPAPPPIAEGPTFYLNWSPGGTSLVAHIGGGPPTLVDPTTGTLDPLLDDGSASYTVPYWLSDISLLTAVDEGDTAVLTIVDLVTRSRDDVARFSGQVAFVPSPDRRAVALQVSSPADGSDVGVNPTGFGAQVDLPQLPAGQLILLDLTTRSISVISPTPAAAFNWSPVGRRLAFLEPVADGRYRWVFWEDGVLGTSAEYTPSSIFWERYQPFFPQYAETFRWWSPDGNAYVFAGASDQGDGIHIQPVAPGSVPTLIDDGVIAGWSPPAPAN